MVLNRAPAFSFKTLDRPWICFFCFTLSNALLAYTPWSMTAKLLIAFYGLVLPATLFFLGRFHNSGKRFSGHGFQLPQTSFLSGPQPFFWVLFGLFFLFTRFYHIDSNPVWPIKDVGHFGILGLTLSQKWDWQLLWGECQSEPLFLWGLGLFFKWIEPSSFSTRVFPALVSIVTMGLAYWAFRRFFSASLSFLAVCFWMLSFWNWVFSRTAIGPLAVLPLECLAFGCCGWALRIPSQPRGPNSWAFVLLGIVTGFGFYSYTVWPVVFLSIFAAVLFKTLKSHPRLSVLFILSVSVTAFPIFWARMGQGGFNHLQEEFLKIPLTQSLPGYLSLLFWNGAGNQPDGPAWGAIFNPLESGLIGMGFLRLVSTWKSAFSRWFFLSFVLFLLPGILSNVIGMCHVIQLLPLLLISLLAGLVELLLCLPTTRRWTAVGVILLASSVLNAYHWWIPYQDWKSLPVGKGDWISGEYARAYGLLKETSRQDGPLYLFSDFNLDYFNKTLDLFCYPFDALQNPNLSGANPRWAALVVNKYYVPFLQKRFPQSRWEMLKKDLLPNNLNLALGLIPVNSIEPKSLNSWKKADQFCRDLDLEIKRRSPPIGWENFRWKLQASYPFFQEDPFLRSVFWEKAGMLDAIQSRYPDCVQDLESAVRSGYPAAHLYYNLSKAQNLAGQPGDSKKNFQKALQIQKTILVP
jgi:hypothetical protein